MDTTGLASAGTEPRTVLHVFSTFEVGGQQMRFAAIANHFGQRWRHVLIAMDGRTGARERLDPALDVSFMEIPVRQGRTLANVRPFRRLLHTMRPSALFTYNFGTIDWAIANLDGQVRHVHVEDGFGPEERDRQLPRRVWLRRLLLRRRTVVVPSQTLLRIAREQWRLPRVQYVPNGVDLARFAGFAPPADGLVVGTVAALRAEKNLSRLIRAMVGLPARLVVVGDGPERPVLEALARTLGVAAQFTGALPDPAAMLATFDVFALSSDTEQMPLSVLEAMAAGKPVASTAVGDVGAMLPAENQPFVVPLADAALHDALAALLADTGLRTRLGAANRARAASAYDQRSMFAAWAQLFGGPG